MKSQVSAIIEEGSDGRASITTVPGNSSLDFIDGVFFYWRLYRQCGHGFSFAPRRVCWVRDVMGARPPCGSSVLIMFCGDVESMRFLIKHFLLQ
ncbi:protein of unknown function [Pseudorhizobium banfieldiae]|uniref:Uncharacterized protein n=1 Tax=Pseudorhizobium banfieldiae TaxID=1125847 RepID=L0NFW6_9HYPH|nr:protein of unknown function [Pseudorhizobium banfieldiae]